MVGADEWGGGGMRCGKGRHPPPTGVPTWAIWLHASAHRDSDKRGRDRDRTVEGSTLFELLRDGTGLFTRRA
jgi:hypothetical protein